MNDLPKVGQKYQHKKWGEVEVVDIRKRGRGYQVWHVPPLMMFLEPWSCERLKDFQKATT